MRRYPEAVTLEDIQDRDKRTINIGDIVDRIEALEKSHAAMSGRMQAMSSKVNASYTADHGE